LRPTLHVNLDAIRHNVGVWRRMLGTRPLWAVVKCDAYRMGMVPVARAALDAGAQALCVVEIEEAAALREAGIDAPIVHVAATPHEDFVTALERGVTVSIGDVRSATELSRLAGTLRTQALAHVAVETGTGWWGVPSDDVASFAAAVARLDNVQWNGVWTHIAGKDSIATQAERFRAAIGKLRKGGLAVPQVHAASTGPITWGFDEGAARVGIGLYGSSWGAEVPNPDLKTAFEVRAPIYAVRVFTQATPLGYGGTYVALAGQTIVTLRIGYGEGLPKALSGRGVALCAGTLCPIVGAIGMNFTMIAVPAGANVDERGEALLAGNTAGIRLDEIALAAQTIPHNVVTMLGSGMTRVYDSAPVTAQRLSPAGKMR
jgi:alanine racemase